jgi:hypothetical protein
MEFMAGFRRMGLAASLVVLACLAACGSSSASSSGTSTSSSPSGSSTSTSAVVANTTLCDLMSKSQVSAVVGGTISMVTKTKMTSGTSTTVNCTFLPASGSGLRIVGQISYLFSSDGRTSYAADQADDTSRGAVLTSISGLGDAAFWDVSPKEPYTMQLSMLKGNILLVMTLLGTNADGSTMLNGAEGLARDALPSL